MRLTLSVEHVEHDGRGTLCAEPSSISLGELGAIKSDVFRWLDSAGIGHRLNDLRPNQVVVKDDADGVMFSAFRIYSGPDRPATGRLDRFRASNGINRDRR